ncbi:CehA/McbA family metallohydrolase [Roseateles sp. BYS87W]|uniref:CehA/McbA family metallohydrolase n=1 Tax=Pelomonas baiyunensis TaxID=3299026 RepID=A0ABW7GU04_9BURK
MSSPRFALRALTACLLPALLAACNGNDTPVATVQPTATDTMSQAAAVHPSVKYPDHHEFEAELMVPFTSDLPSGARRFGVVLSYLGAPEGEQFAYRLELVAPDGRVVQRYAGVELYKGEPVRLNFDWAGRDAGALADGLYEARLTATAADADPKASGSAEARADALLAAGGDHAPHEVSFKFALGKPPAAKMPAYRAMALGQQLTQGEAPRAKAMAASAIASWPYTVYFGSLHGQTNDSDGGGDIASCSSSQAAQTGKYGPDAAFPYAKARGLDFFANTDHNHYFDGSSGLGTIPAATAKSRFLAGVATANTYTANNPGFLATYGMEWGVISGGGHLNIFVSNELYSWEYDPNNDLYGHRFIAKNDYASLYSVMRAQGQVGQFNHPDTTGQFIINGVDFGYTADGDEVMVLAEISNTSAFSNVENESQQPGSGYESAFRKILERGFHVAPATNQDNHCANWGASYTNRTAVLIPNGTPLTQASFIDALKARRVFATHDKNSQLVFSANGAIMGSRINNSGALNLNVGFANTAGRTVSVVEIWEGVPGRNGTMTLLTNNATHSFTPADGAHVYYAKLTQDDGKVLWSAPIWVTQGSVAPGDTTPPTVSGSVTGTSGTITLFAQATDNVGVTKVEFWVDGTLKGTDTTAPYSLALDSKLLSNGAHSLVAKAFDAAGNSTSSTAVNFNVSNAGAGMAETESNGTIATANAIGTATTVTGFISSATDKDYFKVNLAAGQRIRVDMTGPSGVDYDLYLVTSTGAGLASSEGTTASESLTYTNGTTARTVYIKVQSYSGSSTTSGYTLTISYP